MIICHCQNISHDEIDRAIAWMRASDHHAVITPGKVYHALGKRADCGGCLPLFLSHMRKNPATEVPVEVANLRPGSTVFREQGG